MFLFYLFFTCCVASKVHIALKQQNLDILYSTAYDVNNPESKNYLLFWDYDKIVDLVSPPQHVKQDIINWLLGLRIPSQYIEDRGDSIVLNHQIEVSRILTTAPYPDFVKDNIDMIIGLYPVRKNKLIKRKLVPSDSGIVGREVIQRLYNVSNLSGKIDIGVVQYYDTEGFSFNDLFAYQKANGIKVKNITKIIGTEIKQGGEGQLDIQMLSNLEGSNLWFILIDGWIYDFASDYLTWKEYPTITSHSYGWSVYDQCSIVNCYNFTDSDYIRRTNTELAKLALKGATICISSGDAGSPGRTNEACDGKPQTRPVFPASSPWVISVGATYVEQTGNNSHVYYTPLCRDVPCAQGSNESEVSYENVYWTSGAGFSANELAPNWQKSVIDRYLNSGVDLPPNSAFNKNGRAYPDISIVGHNCAVFNHEMITTEDGTSCSSPIMASLIGYLSVKLGKRLGLFTPTLYYLYEKNPNLFNDVINGVSFCTEYQCCDKEWGFSAIQGWDVVSGFGTPNIGKILIELEKII
jgi:hypothetical protein